MLGSANALAQFQMMQMNPMMMGGMSPMMGGSMGMGAGIGFNFGMDSYGGSQFGVNVGMGAGIPFGGFGMSAGFGMSTGMGFGSFPGMGGGFGGGMGFGCFPGMGGMGMNPQMLMMMCMMMMMMRGGGGGMMPMMGGMGGQMPMMGGMGMGMGVGIGMGMNPGNVKISQGNPEQWYFQHGQHNVTDWVDPTSGKKIGTIDEGGDTRIYHNTETQMGYIYKKVDAAAAATNGNAFAAVGVSGWQLTEIREKWGGKSASPIMLDLDGSGTPDVQNGEWRPHANQGDIGAQKVNFDLDGDGRKELTEWTGGKDGLLLKLSPEQIAAYQKDGRLEVSGKEMYGDQGGKYADGYEKMRLTSDANQDGRLSGDELKNHYTWQDANRDGIVDKGELASVQDKGITSINATHGGDFQSSFTMNGQERKTWDWWPTTWQR